MDSYLLKHLLSTLDEGKVVELIIGIHWTAVIVETIDGRRCGLASSIRAAHTHHGATEVPQAGHLHEMMAGDLAALVLSEQSVLASVGLATINALLPPSPQEWVTLNAEEVIAQYGAGKKVALVGHFPFVPHLRDRVGHLSVLEHNPQPDSYPAAMAPAILAAADVVALTSMTIHNHTLPDLLTYCRPDSMIILLGPSTPMSPLLFEYGVDILCGSFVTDIGAVSRVIVQGGNFRQVHRAGVDTVVRMRPRLRINDIG